MHAKLLSYIHACCCCRGQRAVAEASERLQRAMEKADAELEEAQRSRRASRARYHSPRHARGDRPDSNGLHRAGYTAEHDYDRCVMSILRVCILIP